MKKIFIYLLALGAAAGFTACDDNFVQPPMELYTPHATIQPNTTIREFKEAFYQDAASYCVQIGNKANGEHYIVKGRLDTDDANGNLYKKLAIVDENGDALTFSINGSGLSATYKFGQVIVVDLTGLYYGNYSGNSLVGGYAAATDGPARMLTTVWQEHCQQDGMPNPAAVDTTTYTLTELANLRANPIDVDLVQGKLVRINGLHFRNPGNPLGSNSYMNNSQIMEDAEGQQVTLNTCGYGTLWSILAPEGTGDIVGILSNYGNAGYAPVWQVNLLNEYSLIGFDDYNPDVKPATELWGETFLTGTSSFTVDNVEIDPALTYVWNQSTTYGWVASAYNGSSYASDAWLISPVLDMANATEAVLNFDHAANKWDYSASYTGTKDLDFKNYMKLFARVEGGEWQELTIPNYPDNTSWTFLKSGDISLADFEGKTVQIAFQYTSLTGYSGSWEIKNFAIKGNGSITVK